MRLISLTSNQETFHNVMFREEGVSLIVAKQKNPQEADRGKTTNGVGKSLVVTLIHFCLGSNENEKLLKAIPDWEFTLTFELNGTLHTATRNVKKQDGILLDGESISLSKYRDFLEKGAFSIPHHVNSLSFRSLIKRFIRPNKEAYTSFDAVEVVEPPFARLLNMSLILGLDVNLVNEKCRLKKQKDKIEGYLANLEKDTIFKSFFTKDKDFESELFDLDEKIAKLESDLTVFKVAEDYHEIESKANDAKSRLQSISNRITVISNAIAHIEASLNITPDLSLDKINQTYSEAGIIFSEGLKHTLNDITEFHSKLIATRIKRLEDERSKLRDQLKKATIEKKSVGDELDEHLKYLGAHSALDVFLKLTKAVSDYRSQATKLREYKKLLETYRNETQTLKAALAQETIKGEAFLQSHGALITANAAIFRGFAKRFYPDKPSGLSVVNNDGDNQIRFEILAKIQSDASDGINEVKIFCFDMTILKLGLNNNVKFLFHDSRLFSDVDARQAATLFKILSEEITSNKLQYIATVNEDQINSVKKHYSDEEFETIINKNIIMTLTDESAAAKLLGVQVDIE
jgi:uncharacterized protein YydD (DUF2326 family)